jgi:transposase InsO family protein
VSQQEEGPVASAAGEQAVAASPPPGTPVALEQAQADAALPSEAQRMDSQARLWRLVDGDQVQGNSSLMPVERTTAAVVLPRSGSRRRGWPGQRQQRQREQQARRHGVQFRQQVAGQGCNRAEAARLLGVKPRTLRLWEQNERHGGLPARPLGRPTARSSVARRNEVLRVLAELGPGVALATLRGRFPEMARAELNDLLRRYRRVWRKRHERLVRTLHWHRAGSVWAMDYTQAPVAIEGCYPHVLTVRDLSSHYVLLWLPVVDQSEQTARAALRRLFAEHGSPLLMKSDNGSAFHADGLSRLLSGERVAALYSPAYTPSYNGGVEATNGSLKTRAHHQATRAGRPEGWTCDDVEAARQEANEQARPWGENGPAPSEVWQKRQRISNEERKRFAEVLQEKIQEVLREQQEAKERDPSYPTDQARAQREAISRTLVALDYLSYTRRRIPSPI